MKQNERETFEAFIRDRAEKEELIFRHLDQRRSLNTLRTQERNEHQRKKQEIRQDVQHYKGMLSELREQRLEEYRKERRCRDSSKTPQNRNRSRSLKR
ncbi:MAG: hypothetical protein ACRESZ_18315 [Methylococcales bacterium]